MCRGENLFSDESVDAASVGVEAKAELESGAMKTAGEGAEGGAPESAETPTGIGLASWLRDVLVSVAVSAFIITFLYQPVRVEGTSMLPMLRDQDRLFINKMAYRVGEIHRGDVVVFLYPHDHTKSYIKRVIAVGGDDLRIDHGQVYVNGKALEESYVPLRFTDDRSQPDMVIPPHEYFVMGDHRSISSDSRDFGPVEGDLIYGKAAFVYWPIEQIGVVR
jgi:signal peptidase I